MANLTITIDGEVLRAARTRAVAQGTSVNSLLREYLEAYAGTDDRRKEAVRALLNLASGTRSARGRRRWTREELHER